MSDGAQHFWDLLSTREAEFAASIMRELVHERWAEPLLRDIADTGGLTRANKAKLFELRFGYALHRAGIVPQYEVGGEANSTLDFGFTSSGQRWLVELMRLEETQAVREATQSAVDGPGVLWSQQILSSDAEDPRQSEEGETLKAVQRICQKCERDGRPYKFPEPNGALHVLLVDFRTFLHGGDAHDMIHVGLGGEYVAERFCRRYWEGQLISGVFSPNTTVRGADNARARVHLLGFVDEDVYEPGVLGLATRYIANPWLFASADEVRAAASTWPLQPAVVLNGG